MSAPLPSPSNAETQDMRPLRSIIESGEAWLVNRILNYAKQRDYVKYTSTLVEAWRASIAGLSSALLQIIDAGAVCPEPGPDEDFTKDPPALFGIIEAQKHRSRGGAIGMFLGLMKYYRQSYLDLVRQAELDQEKKNDYAVFIGRCFDRIELGYASAWCTQTNNETVTDLRAANHSLTHEKNLYLALFESMPDPAILFNERHELISANHAAMQLLSADAASGETYYGPASDLPLAFPAWVNALPDRLSPETGESSFTKRINSAGGVLFFEIRLRRILDVSGKFSGLMAVLKDITLREQTQEALGKSEEAFRALFESSRDAIMLLDRKGFFDCNKTTLDLFGCTTKEQFVSKQPSDLSPPLQPDGRESLAVAQERIEAAYAEGVQFFEWIHQRMDGSTFPAEVLLSRFDLGEKTVLQAVVRDISARKKAGKTLRDGQHALQQKYAELNRVFTLVETAKREWERTMDCVDDMVLLADSGGRIRRCNKALAQFIGRPYDKILGEDWTSLLNEHEIEVEKQFEKNGDVFHKPSDRWFTVNSYPVTGISADAGAGFVVTFHDFTARKKMTHTLEQKNREIEEHRQALQSALNELSNLIQQAESEQTFAVRFKNPHLATCHEMTSCTEEACLCHGKEAMRCWQIAGTHCGGKVQTAGAQKLSNCSNCTVFKAATANPIYQIGEHFNNMMHILDLKNRELRNAYSELQTTQAKIVQQEKMASIGQLAAGVAHEINNPMGFILSNLGTLDKYLSRLIEYSSVLAGVASGLHDIAVDERLAAERKRLKIGIIMDDAKKLVAESLDGAERVKVIVQNLKSFSRVDQGQAISADVNECIETTLNIVWNELKYKAAVNKEYGVLPRIWCYPQQLNQVFMNLLVNAAHAIDRQGVITIRTWVDAGSIFASIADTGCGIPPKNLTRIFEPFFTTKEVGKGTGLGLSITYDIIKKHNGVINVQSDPGKGTVFTIELPIKTAYAPVAKESVV